MKRLVLVVHGVGEQGAGDTLDNFAGTITNNVEANVESELVWLREDHEHHDPRKLETFACHTRHISEPSGNETKMAEVHWADLSKGPTGTISTIVELISTLLGLGYIARANVREVHDDPDYTQKLPSASIVAETIENKWPSLAEVWTMLRARPWQIRAVDFFVLMAHGPNAVLNALLALGVLLSYLIFQFVPDGIVQAGGAFWAHGIIGLASAVFVAYGAMSRPTNRLRRQFTDSLFVVGLIGLAVMGFYMILGALGVVTGQAATFDLYITTMIYGLQMCWLVMFLLSGSLVIDWLRGRDALSKRSRAATVYPQTIAGMAVFWLIFSNIFWVTMERSVGSNPELSDLMSRHLLGALGLLWIVMAAAVAVLIAGIVVVRARANWIKSYRADHTSDAERNTNPVSPQPDHPPTSPLENGSEVPRLLLNPLLGKVLTAFLMIMVAGAIYLFIERFLAGGQGEPATSYTAANKAAALITAGIGGVLILFWPFLRPQLATGLGVGKDVVNYFVDFKPYRTPRQGINQMLRDPDKRLDFWLRNRINDRFFIVLETMKRAFKPDEIYVISHSQGTIISVCSLAQDKVIKAIGNTPLKLVTMGSPYTHIYRHYFPEMFKFDDVSDNLAKNWINIYRVDDFVGTHVESRDINGQQHPRNFPVHPAGHTGYWFDSDVLDIIEREVGLTFPTPVPAPVPAPASKKTKTKIPSSSPKARRPERSTS